MPIRALVAFVSLVSLAAVACGGEADQAAPPQPKTPPPAVVALPESFPSELVVLRPLVGRYPRDIDLWNREPLAARLHALLAARFEDLLRNTEVQGPLLEEQGILYVTGNQQYSGGSDAAALVVDLRRDALWVWLLVDGESQVFLERDVDIELPADVRIVIENADLEVEPPGPEDGGLEDAESP